MFNTASLNTTPFNSDAFTEQTAPISTSVRKAPTLWKPKDTGIATPSNTGFSILLETGDHLLLEDGFRILLEDSVVTEKSPVNWKEN